MSRPTKQSPGQSPASAARRKIGTILRRLFKVYGRVDPPPDGPVLDELVATILSQNTSDANSTAAFASLERQFADWDAVRTAPVKRIARAIRCGGLAEQKAPRIKAILQQIHDRHGSLSLEMLREMPACKALEYLRGFKGVGPKTAACVLLFACRQPVLPVDTHVHRVSRRLGLIAPEADAARAHDLLALLVPAARVLEFHIQLIRHGRKTCAARRPDCEHCVLADLCPEGMMRLSRGA
ncbi:MAG: endonuclease III [Thermoguttaceae bacterium]|nr:endonuclease III [Thermoguttaceae bacterium]